MKYTVEISNINGTIDGMLIVNQIKKMKVHFSPINILGDIFSLIYSDSIVDAVLNHDRANIARDREQMKMQYYSFETSFKLPRLAAEAPELYEVAQYSNVVDNLLLFFNFKDAVTLVDIDSIKRCLGLNFKWKAYYINCKTVCCEGLRPSGNLMEWNIEDCNQIKYNLNEKDTLCVFQCNSKADVIFSILQFLLLSGYYFEQCLHCQKFYALKTQGSGFCRRNSPYVNFEMYECREAVKAIKKHLQEKKRAVLSNIIGKSGTSAPSKLGVENVYNELKSQFYLRPNVQNLSLCEAFLTNDEMKAQFYSRKN